MSLISRVSIDQIRFNFPYETIKLAYDPTIDGIYYDTDEYPELCVGHYVFEFDEIFELPKAVTPLNGYTNAFCYGTEYKEGTVTVSFNRNRKDMGILIDFTASGKRLFETIYRMRYKYFSWKRLINTACRDLNGHITRIDVAIDLVNSDFDLDILDDEIEKEQVGILNSRGQLIKDSSYKVVKTLKGVQTIYVGSRKSDAFLRIYDKRREQIEGNRLLFGLADTIDSWIRIEGEFKHKTAHKIGEEISNQDQMHDFLINLIFDRWKIVDQSDSQKGPSIS